MAVQLVLNADGKHQVLLIPASAEPIIEYTAIVAIEVVTIADSRPMMLD